MTRNRFLSYTALAIAVVACGGKLLTITISDTAEIEVEEGTPLDALLGDFGFDEFTNLDITSNQQLANQGVAPGDISEVYFDELSLTVTEPTGGDLSFIESIEFFVSADGLPTVLVASQDSFPEGQAKVELELEGVDIVDYVVSESMDLTTEVRGGRPDADTTIEAFYSLKVGATAQGACNQLGNN